MAYVMHDALGRELKVGDVVLVPIRVAFLNDGDDLSVQNEIGGHSVFDRTDGETDGEKQSFAEINTGVTIRANPGDEASQAEWWSAIRAITGRS